MNRKAIFSAFFLTLGASGVAMSQSAPSWRSAAERPERVDAPPEVGAPDITFEVDRDALFGKPMGFAPEPEPVASQPDLISVQPEVIGEPPADLTMMQPPGKGDANDEADLSPAQPSLVLPEPKPQPQPTDPETLFGSSTSDINPTDIKVDSDMASLPGQEVPAPEPVNTEELPSLDGAISEAQQEREAVQEAATVDPEQSVASVGDLPPVKELVKPKPPGSGYKLVRTKTVAPEYPKQAARLGEIGWVDLRIIVDPDGNVSKVTVIDAKPRQLFDKAARRAARQWRYEPPELAGIEEPIAAQIRLNFVLD